MIEQLSAIPFSKSMVPRSRKNNLISIHQVEALRPKLAQVAQKIYDAWNPEDRDTYAGGGICHIIAEEICGELYIKFRKGNFNTVSSSHEQHVYSVGQFKEGVYSIDVPYSIYETGGGFSWKKIEGVEFEPNDIVLYKIDGDPNSYSEYVDND